MTPDYSNDLPPEPSHRSAAAWCILLSTWAVGLLIWSVYDAAYLELAQRRSLSLGCKDGPLRQAATRAGVSLWR